MSFSAAASEPTNQTVVGESDAQVVHANNNTVNNVNSKQVNAYTSGYSVNKAAGSAAAETANTSTMNSGQSAGITVSQSELFSAASRVKSFINTNHRLPTTVTVGDNQLSMAQYLQLVTQGFYDLNYGKSRSIVVDDVNDPSNPTASVVSGNIPKSEYVQIAKSVIDYIDVNGQAPNYISSSIGNIRFDALIYSFSKIVNFYDSNNRMPTNVAVSTLDVQYAEGAAAGSSSYQSFLVASKNCQSTSSTIKNLADSITKGKTSTYAKAQAIFNWVRDHLSYSFYYNTKKGALGALSSRSANCCDTTHLVVALTRAAGIPARYHYGKCKFSDGWYGHVYAQVYVNGKWYYADAVSNKNTFGNINNWTSEIFYKNYASLPF
jgi:transglutaminase-like putative cysteine protease